MIAVITGDIIASRKLVNQEKWLIPLKELFNSWSQHSKEWRLERGDFFQIEITDTAEALKKVFQIKALIKNVSPANNSKKMSTIDVRLAAGIGHKNFEGETIYESNGPAFINSGEKFDLLRKEHTTMGIKSPWEEVDEVFNLYLKLVSVLMEKWTVSSAELAQIVLSNPNITQQQIGYHLGIKQSAVSRRWNRANMSEILEVESLFNRKINSLIS